MIRYYLDSQIYRYLNKDKYESYNEQLQKVMDSLYGKILFCYSEAHLNDLSNSKKKDLIDIDLNITGKYVKDNYFTRNHIKKYTSCYLVEPKTAYYDKYHDGVSEIENPLDVVNRLIAGIVKDDTTGIGDLLSHTWNSFLNTPALDYDDVLRGLSNNDDAKLLMEKMFPVNKSVLNMRDIVQYALPYGNVLLQNAKEFTWLRKYSSRYINNDISFEKWGLEFSNKMKDSPLGKSFLEQVDSVLVNDQKNDFYHRFTMAYSFLELFGIDREKDNNNKLKVFNYGNMFTDSAHAYYATYCDYLVTNDKGLQTKAYILYSIFNIPTKILTLEEFINRQNIILFQEEVDYKKFTDTLVYDIKHSLLCSEENNIVTLANVKNYIPNHIYFNYFNRFQIVTNKEGHQTILLYCKRDSHADFYMYREIKVLTDKILRLFGTDDENLLEYVIPQNGAKDISHGRDTLRCWTFSNLKFELCLSNGFICLQINIIDY